MSFNKTSFLEQELYYEGDLTLLDRPKVSIVGSRQANSYAKNKTHEIASKLSSCGVAVVSGGAIGIDAIAHKAARQNTIAVFGNGIDINYPAINKSLLQSIRSDGLVLSQFEIGFRPTKWSFVQRNHTVVSLGQMLIVTHAQCGSGSERSIEIALKQQKQIFVLPHRIGESSATQKLLLEGKATAIYDIDHFIAQHFECLQKSSDEFLEFCRANPSYEEAVQLHGDRVYEYELEGKIANQNGLIIVL
jgi:DNA processing protein